MDSAHADGNPSDNNNRKVEDEFDNCTDDEVCVKEIVTDVGNIKQEPYDMEGEQGITHNCTGIKEEIDDPIVTGHESELTTDTKENYLICCEECGKECDLYCLKCPMLIRILDSNKPNLLDNRVRRTLPKHFIDICETSSGIGIVALRVIPKGIVFGPFEELDSIKGATGSRWKLQNKELAYTKDPKRLNWMQYIRRADLSCHQNLTAFQFEDKVYYRSDCPISVGDELLVSFDSGSEENGIEDTNDDSYWEPQVCERLDDTYACTFCCVGYKSISYLSAHNSKCPEKINQTDFCKEIIQCAFCKIHLDEKEYSNYHIDRCCGGNTKKYVATSRSADPTDKLEPKDTQYKCPLCDYRTSKKNKFRKHREGHTDDIRTYTCSECPFRASTKCDLQNHARAHFGRNRFECQHCPERFFRHDLFAAHLKKEHSVSVYRCDKCAFETTNAKHLRRHLPTHEDVKPYRCDACDKQFKSRTVLLGHVRMVHNEKKKKYKCPKCDLETVYPGTIKTHLLNMHGGVKRFKCLRCTFKTHYKRDLERHLRFHDDAKPIKCESCETEFWGAYALRRHEKEAHAITDKIYSCSKCEYQTRHRGYLKNHLKGHARLQLTCALCPYRTNLNSNLKRHLAITHNDDRPFKCDACRQTFKEKASLKSHARNVHADAEMEYKCSQCAFETKYKDNFKNHLKAHIKSELFRCSKCDFNTHSKGSLTTHVKRLHGENGPQSFHCSTCDKKFEYKASLTRHTRRFHGPKVEEEKLAIESDE